jgi:hypothetical protein
MHRGILLLFSLMIFEFLMGPITEHIAVAQDANINGNDTNQNPNNARWDTFLAGAIGASVGSAGTIIATSITSRSNRQITKINIEKDLKKEFRDQRMTVYADLFRRTKDLALHDLSTPLTIGDVD